MSVFESKKFDSHEGIHFFSDEESGLKAIIAVHNTNLGPAAGGTRLWSYENSEAAIDDALNLSRAMSYKNAMAGIPFGGGKAVIMRPEGAFDRTKLFTAYGKAIESLGGVYCTAEDVGVSTADMEVVRKETRFVGGLDHGNAASGDPSPVTAEGVFRGLHIATDHALGRPDLSGLRVAVQGLGHVGYSLCEKLSAAGAQLWVADINDNVIERAVRELGAIKVSTDAIHAQDVDIFAPCALGGAINPETIQHIKAKIIGGAANNQLASPEMGHMLKEMGILYCPDYVINGGGIINVAAELSGTYDFDWVDDKLNGLAKTLGDIFDQAFDQGMSTHEVADQMALMRIFAS